MIAKEVSTGSGFGRCAGYITQEGRADWIETRNLPTDDPQIAARIMAATAAGQDSLKRAAGVSTRGRKCTDPALHMVMSYRAGERPTRERVTADAESLLKAHGLERHQVLMAAHVDKDHLHVHLLVNRVSWDDGRTKQRGFSHRICSTWASNYERAARDIQCPRREVVRAAHEAGRPIPPRQTPAPSIRRDRATGRPQPRSAAETAVYRQCRRESLAAGDTREEAKARRVAYSRQIEATRPARRTIEDIALPPLRPPGRAWVELLEAERRLLDRLDNERAEAKAAKAAKRVSTPATPATRCLPGQAPEPAAAPAVPTPAPEQPRETTTAPPPRKPSPYDDEDEPVRGEDYAAGGVSRTKTPAKGKTRDI